MTVRELPSRQSMPHAVGQEAPDDVNAPRFSEDRDSFGMPSQRTVWEVEFLAARRAKTMAVSRRTNAGPRRASAGHSHVHLPDRIDPFWEIEWNDQFGGGGWQRVSARRNRLTTDPRGNIVAKTTEAFAPIAFAPNESYGEKPMRIMALLFQFGGLTSSQLCSFMDSSLKGISYALNRLYAMGLVERMTPGWVVSSPSSRPYHGSGDVWRVNLRSDTITPWLEGLSSIEYALMTGGRDANDLLHNGTFLYDHTLRHNLSVAELCLRGLETMPGVAGVWGEPFVQGDKFLSEVVRNSMELRYVRGDAAIVTKDGAVIVIELTGVRALSKSHSEHGATIAQRAATWAMISHLSEVPISLVVASIGGYTASRRIAKHLRDNIDEEMGKYFANVADRERAMKSIHVASVQSWWPSAGTVSRKFLTMEAFSPFTNEYRELAPADAKWDTTNPVVVNTVAALHTPPWVMRPVEPVTGKGFS